MHLRRLELQGFKTFANRTEFEFDSGVTAIVGPNGSGKSNIADAIRWVLGEQTPRLLRAKRAEDLIFAGSHSRAPLGMAEVTVTLDNSQSWSSLPYHEIAVTRRAYRSGENEYLINRQRVRLRDVTDLLAKANLGQNTYTVIGQGLVDAVLSLRPEERRELFEEAADIRRFYTKLNEAQSKLAATEQNIVRVNDIAAEIFPRLGSLEKQARLAEQRLALAQELDMLQRAWYAHLQSKARSKADDASAREKELNDRLAELHRQEESLSQRISEIREIESQTRASLARWREDAEPLRAEYETLTREVAIDEERVRTYDRQLEELRHEIEALKMDEVGQADRLLEARQHSIALEAERQNTLAEVARVEKELEEARRRTADVMASLSSLRANAFQVTATSTDIEEKLAHVRGKRQAIERESRERESAMERRLSQARALEARVESLKRSEAELGTKLESLRQRYQEVQSLAINSSQKQDQLIASLDGHQRKKHELQTRYELISKWEDSQTGYFPGVRAVLQASRARRNGTPVLSGIVGIVGKAIQPGARVETAIEVALGSRVQDVIVERWRDAEKAIAFLKSTGSGRATFLPLDTIRSAPAQPPQVAEPGVLGVAAELVHFDRRFQSIVNLLLGRTIVVEDLKVARRALQSCPAGWQIVTVSGEMVRSSGAITGGSLNQQTGMLSRIRELRELPDEIAAVERTIKEEQDSLANEKSKHRLLIAEQSAIERERRETESKTRNTKEELSSLQRELERVRSDLQWMDLHRQELSKELDQLASSEAAYSERLQQISSERAAASETLQAAEAETLNLRQEEGRLSAKLSDLKVSLAVIQQREAALAENVKRGESTIDALRKQIDAKQTKASEIEGLGLSVGEKIVAGRTQLQHLGERLRTLEGLVGPTEERIAQLGAEYNNLLQEETRLRVAHHELLSLHQQAALEAQKACDELEALNQRIKEELGDELGQEDRQDLDLTHGSAIGSSVGADAERSPEEIKRRIDQLKGGLKSLASVSPRAIEEYEEALTRYNFLTEQAEDLRRGAESLRQVIAELHKTMKRRFEETFKAVASEFQTYFRTLFGGGTARLTLTDPHDFVQTGVEIVVQPPGKRPQNLAALSGGERALTGVALLFAILKVNPTPVCVLDEVDAALDEANIGRFCVALRGLAEETQFIIITHNRGTMEIANALYGVSMREVGVSRIVSLRLTDVEDKGSRARIEPGPAAQLATAL